MSLLIKSWNKEMTSFEIHKINFLAQEVGLTGNINILQKHLGKL